MRPLSSETGTAAALGPGNVVALYALLHPRKLRKVRQNQVYVPLGRRNLALLRSAQVPGVANVCFVILTKTHEH